MRQDLKSKGSKIDNLLLVSVSLDPENDTPEVMKEHAKKMKFDLSYLKMLTGDKNQIQSLADTLGEHFEKPREKFCMIIKRLYLIRTEG